MEFISLTLGFEDLMACSSAASPVALIPTSCHRVRCQVMKRRTRRSRAAMEKDTTATSSSTTTTLLPPSCSVVLEDLPSSTSANTSTTTLSRHMAKYNNNRNYHFNNKYLRNRKDSMDDDATLETVQTYEDEHSLSVSNLTSVSFADPVVTEVHYRDWSVETPRDKARLFYTDADYQAFRREFIVKQRLLRMQRHGQHQLAYEEDCEDESSSLRKRVQFCRNVVSDVFVYSCAGALAEKDLLFYSEHDLQRFLDEFVSSLNGVLSDCRS